MANMGRRPPDWMLPWHPTVGDMQRLGLKAWGCCDGCEGVWPVKLDKIIRRKGAHFRLTQYTTSCKVLRCEGRISFTVTLDPDSPLGTGKVSHIEIPHYKPPPAWHERWKKQG